VVRSQPPEGVLSDFLHCKNLPLAQARLIGEHGKRTLLLYGFVADDGQKSDAERAVLDFIGDRSVHMVDALKVRPEIGQMDSDDEARAESGAADAHVARADDPAQNPASIDEIPGEQFAPPRPAPSTAAVTAAVKSAPPASAPPVDANSVQSPAQQPIQPERQAQPQIAAPNLQFYPIYGFYQQPAMPRAAFAYGFAPGFYAGTPLGVVPPRAMATTLPTALFLPPAMAGLMTQPALIHIQPQNAWPHRAAASPFSSHLFPLGTTR